MLESIGRLYKHINAGLQLTLCSAGFQRVHQPPGNAVGKGKVPCPRNRDRNRQPQGCRRSSLAMTKWPAEPRCLNHFRFSLWVAGEERPLRQIVPNAEFDGYAVIEEKWKSVEYWHSRYFLVFALFRVQILFVNFANWWSKHQQPEFDWIQSPCELLGLAVLLFPTILKSSILFSLIFIIHLQRFGYLPILLPASSLSLWLPFRFSLALNSKSCGTQKITTRKQHCNGGIACIQELNTYAIHV